MNFSYEEVDRRRKKRQARRMERIRREERRARVLMPLKVAAEVIGGGILFYLTLLAGSLWSLM